MARMKRIANRYGKITLASLGGFLMTLGAFLIVLSSATVPNVAKATTTGCHQFSSPQPNHICTYVDMYGDGSYVYWDCCHECGFFPAAVASDPDYDCTGVCYDYSGDGIDDTCECCTATTQSLPCSYCDAPAPAPPATCPTTCAAFTTFSGPAGLYCKDTVSGQKATTCEQATPQYCLTDIMNGVPCPTTGCGCKPTTAAAACKCGT